MIRKKSIKNSVVKKPYHTVNFYIPKEIEREILIDNRGRGVAGKSVDTKRIKATKYAEELLALNEVIKIDRAYIERGTLVVWIDPNGIISCFKALKKQKYDILTEMSAIDMLETNGNFELFYQLLSMSKKRRMRVKCAIKDGDSVESISSLYKSADWSERECFDMFGIRFLNHPNLKRILMPDDWSGYPLRKSYPLHGDEAARWYEVDVIFGKEYREAIGEEQRDSARVDRYDTVNFAHIGFEVAKGSDISDGESVTPIKYQEDKKPIFIRRYDPKKTKLLKERR